MGSVQYKSALLTLYPCSLRHPDLQTSWKLLAEFAGRMAKFFFDSLVARRLYQLDRHCLDLDLGYLCARLFILVKVYYCQVILAPECMAGKL